MLRRDQVGRDEAAIEIAVRTEVNGVAGHNALTRGALRPVINGHGASDDSGGAAELKRVADEIEHNLRLLPHRIPTHRNGSR